MGKFFVLFLFITLFFPPLYIILQSLTLSVSNQISRYFFTISFHTGQTCHSCQKEIQSTKQPRTQSH